MAEFDLQTLSLHLSKVIPAKIFGLNGSGLPTHRESGEPRSSTPGATRDR